MQGPHRPHPCVAWAVRTHQATEVMQEASEQGKRKTLLTIPAYPLLEFSWWCVTRPSNGINQIPTGRSDTPFHTQPTVRNARWSDSQTGGTVRAE